MSRRRLSRLVALLALAAVAAACAREDAAAGSPIDPAELAARLASGTAPVILDVRTAEEFADGHIPGALNVPVAEFSDRLAALELAPAAEIVVHCQSGRRAATAEAILAEAGYTNVRDLSGHMLGWRAAGHPLE
jgi:rhodanese-related sulfurtransferase